MNNTDLKTVVENANRIFAEIKKKYRNIKAYLVLSSPSGLCDLTSTMHTIVKDFPEMVHESMHKKEACALLGKIPDVKQKIDHTSSAILKIELSSLKSSHLDQRETVSLAKLKSNLNTLNKEMDDTLKRLAQVSENAEMKEGTYVELRFIALDYDILEELRTDPLISLKYTPQTRASIRIALGTLQDLSSMR